MAITIRFANAMVLPNMEAFMMLIEQSKKTAKALSTIIPK
jgi:hypothetical protein